MQIKVLGTGCANCKTTFKLIEDVAKEIGVAVEMEKIEDLPSIMGYGVMSTPGVVVDGTVVHAGGIPARSAVEGWLAGKSATTSGDGGCCSGSKCC